MGRPSLTARRTHEILEAFARCVARRGLEATSLQDVADEAGHARPILRHYVGNRSDLVVALARHVGATYRDRLRAMVDALPETGRADALLGALLPTQPSESAGEILVLESLIAKAAEDADVREAMLDFVEHTLRTMRRVLRDDHPKATAAQVKAVAYGIVSIWFNHSSLTPIRPPATHRRAALAAARTLVASLPA